MFLSEILFSLKLVWLTLSKKNMLSEQELEVKRILFLTMTSVYRTLVAAKADIQLHTTGMHDTSTGPLIVHYEENILDDLMAQVLSHTAGERRLLEGSN